MSTENFINAIKQLEGRDKVLLIQQAVDPKAQDQQLLSTVSFLGRYLLISLDMAALEKSHLYCANTTTRAELVLMWRHGDIIVISGIMWEVESLQCQVESSPVPSYILSTCNIAVFKRKWTVLELIILWIESACFKECKLNYNLFWMWLTMHWKNK